MSGKYIDITVPLHPNLPVWPGDRKIEITKSATMEKDGANVSNISMSLHGGTHIDGPSHFVEGLGHTIDIPLDQLIGECQVIEIFGTNVISVDDLKAAGIDLDIKKILFKTDNSALWKSFSHPFYEDFCALDASAAQWLVDHQFEFVGIDYHSIQKYNDPPDVHLILLREKVVILETINLMEVTAGKYEIWCLPIKIEAVDGSPARVLLKAID